MSGVPEKHHAHELIERLPDSARALATAPPDDEPVTEQDRRRFHGGQAWFAQRSGKSIPMETVLTEFGLKPEDFPLGR
jgi:hypothetical protein